MLSIESIPAFEDNYIWLLLDGSGKTAVVDPGDAKAVERALDRRKLRLDCILNTHHHWDHTGGNAALKRRYGCAVIGPAADARRIPGMDTGVRENDMVSIGDAQARVIETPGHTTGHVCFWFEKDRALFCGDTLFSMGTGRLFEGTPEIMWASLRKIDALPDDAMIYCAHEYTEENGDFCMAVDPDNPDLKIRMDEVRKLRAAGKPTLPVHLGIEKKTNALLRATSPEAYGALRKRKDER
ncbi:MAG: hydroxyacylglutathione hydrolase [Proteobacteria bacterium]|nr:hydroxyacylglutathione hydrolase [Pseudomonadota bacterium]